jgi:hypothetical protein
MVSSIATCLALTPWTPVSHQNSLPVRYDITIEAPEISIDEEHGCAHYEPEGRTYDRRGHVHEERKRGLFIDSYC